MASLKVLKPASAVHLFKNHLTFSLVCLASLWAWHISAQVSRTSCRVSPQCHSCMQCHSGMLGALAPRVQFQMQCPGGCHTLLCNPDICWVFLKSSGGIQAELVRASLWDFCQCNMKEKLCNCRCVFPNAPLPGLQVVAGLLLTVYTPVTLLKFHPFPCKPVTA